jgi:hypothetical protein
MRGCDGVKAPSPFSLFQLLMRACRATTVKLSAGGPCETRLGAGSGLAEIRLVAKDARAESSCGRRPRRAGGGGRCSASSCRIPLWGERWAPPSEARSRGSCPVSGRSSSSLVGRDGPIQIASGFSARACHTVCLPDAEAHNCPTPAQGSCTDASSFAGSLPDYFSWALRLRWV